METEQEGQTPQIPMKIDEEGQTPPSPMEIDHEQQTPLIAMETDEEQQTPPIPMETDQDEQQTFSFLSKPIKKSSRPPSSRSVKRYSFFCSLRLSVSLR